MPPSAPSADQILLNAGCANPYPDYAELRSCAPVTKLSNQSVYLVSRYSDLVSVLKQPEFYSSRVPGFLRRKDDGVLEWVDAPSSEESGQILGAEDPPRHTEQRKFLSRTFHQRVKALEPALQSYCEREVAALMTNEGEVDFMAQIARRLPIWVVGQLLGLPESDYPRLAELYVEAGRSDDAIAAYRKLLDQGGDPATRFRLGVLLWNRGQKTEGAQLVQAAVTQDPGLLERPEARLIVKDSF